MMAEELTWNVSPGGAQVELILGSCLGPWGVVGVYGCFIHGRRISF